MRIRRYAARLLASSAPASSPPPRPDAPWLHAAADDCDFCQLTRGSDPQVAPDGIKHKGHLHIAGPEPEAELLKTHDGDLAQPPPVPQAQPCEIHHEHSAREDAAVELEITRGAATRLVSQVSSDGGVKHEGHIAGPEPEGELLKSDARIDLPRRPHAPEESIPAQRCEIDYDEHATRPERTEVVTLVSEVSAQLAVKGGAFVVDEATDEQEAGETSPLVNGSVTAPEVTEEVPLLSGSVAEPEVVIRGSSIADEASVEREVLGGVSTASGLIAEPEVIRGAPRADKDVVDQEDSEGVSFASEAATGPGRPADVVTVPGVTTGAPLDDKGIREPDVKMEASSVNESAAEMDKMESSSLKEAAAEMDKMEASSVNEAAAEMDKMESSSLREAAAEMDKMEAFSVNEAAAEMDVVRLGSLVIEAATHPGRPQRVSLANEAASECDVSEGVSPATEAATEPADVVTMSKVTTGAPLDDKGVSDTDIEMGDSSVNESAAEMDKMEASSFNEAAAQMDVVRLGSLVIEPITHPGRSERVSLANEAASERVVSEGVSPASEAATEPADVVTVSKVTTGAPLDDKGVADTDIEMGDSSVNESAAGMDFTPLGSVVIEAATYPELLETVYIANENATEREVSGGVLPVRETAMEPADVVTTSGVTTGAPLDNEGIAEPDIKIGSSSVDESSAKINVIRLVSHVSEAATDPGLPESVSLANETATEREVSECVSLLSEAATEPADVVTALEVTTGIPLDNECPTEPETEMGASLVDESTAEPEVEIGASLVNESTTEKNCEPLGSPVIEGTTHPGLAEKVSHVSEVATETGVTGPANLDTEVSVEPEATGGPSLKNEWTEMETTVGVSIAKEAAAEPEVTGEASACSEDGGTALNEPQPLDYDLDCATVQVENARVSVANEVRPSKDDASDEVGSISSTSTGPVTEKSPTADEAAPHDDTPSISCISGIVARSVGKSGRSDVICYARRRGKRKLDMAEISTEEIKMDDGDIYDQCEGNTTLKRTAPCESAMSTAGSAEIKLSDIKRGLADNSASSKCKRRKGRFECDIDYCRMAFKKRSELSVHKKNMCTVKSCGKRFRSHKYLRRHQSIHNDDTPYKCPWEDCSMAFKWTWSLADHFQVHTGEKPYRCKMPGCSKIYKYVSDFIRHKKRCKPQVKT